MYPKRLKKGDEIRVIAPSISLSSIKEDIIQKSLEFLQSQGFKISFGKNAKEIDEFYSSSIESRLDDLHNAFLDKNVSAILTAKGGFNSNELLDKIDYDIISKNPKILCGYSDITALLNAIYAKTGLITYHGPHFSKFCIEENRDYTLDNFYNCISNNQDFEINPSLKSKSYSIIQKGKCRGSIIGGNLCTLNLLQGTPYMPDIKNKVIFIEDDNIMGEFFPFEFNRNLQSLFQIKNADTIKGIVFGRFTKDCKISESLIQKIIKDKISPDIPVIYNVDFGHIMPMITFPIGGDIEIQAYNDKLRLIIKGCNI